ncbi:MAG: 2-hydroxymuconate tautomerase family protein [Proteobacteria bacterium]|nr:2-hydroxymuconate tautomerase family protein [Pseudomonadota bacterium]
MPIAHISILEGRGKAAKAELIREVTDAICRSIGAPQQAVRVLIHEVAKEEWGIGGETAESLGR